LWGLRLDGEDEDDDAACGKGNGGDLVHGLPQETDRPREL
jgi:hypothetical protein